MRTTRQLRHHPIRTVLQLEILESRYLLNAPSSGPQLVAAPSANPTPVQVTPQQKLAADIGALLYDSYRTSLDVGILSEEALLPESGPAAVAAMLLTAAQKGGNMAHDLYALANDFREGKVDDVFADFLALSKDTAASMVADGYSVAKDLYNIGTDLSAIFLGTPLSGKQPITPTAQATPQPTPQPAPTPTPTPTPTPPPPVATTFDPDNDGDDDTGVAGY